MLAGDALRGVADVLFAAAGERPNAGPTDRAAAAQVREGVRKLRWSGGRTAPWPTLLKLLRVHARPRRLIVPCNEANSYNLAMSSGRASLIEPEIVVQHVSPFGPNVTHVRGTLLAGSQATLRELGVYERYQELVAPEMRDSLLCVLASSWVPIEVAVAHYEVCDALMLDQAQIKAAGERMASRVIDTFAGAALRTARSMGADSFWIVLQQNDRFYDRLYQGGGVTILQTGPKDVILENYGQPLATIRYWRASYLAYMEALGKAFTTLSFVKLVHPRTPGPHAIAVTGSWV